MKIDDKNKTNVVILNDNRDTTDYLLQSTKNKNYLMESIGQLKDGLCSPREEFDNKDTIDNKDDTYGLDDPSMSLNGNEIASIRHPIMKEQMHTHPDSNLIHLFKLIKQLPSHLFLNKHIGFDLVIMPIGGDYYDVSYLISVFDLRKLNGIHAESSTGGLFWNNPLNDNQSEDTLIWVRISLNDDTLETISDKMNTIITMVNNLRENNWVVKPYIEEESV